MATINFTSHLQRYLDCPPLTVSAATVHEALSEAFAGNVRLAGYILDDQQRLRKNVVIFVDGQQIQDRRHLSDRLGPNSEIYILQALSGG
ncbi:MoaD/ThiS family protein [Marinobacterium rhizophilum]|uniref:MoaD/ThiS family protein n=1 Tax=Marinobacterium rhizophilum TaxID=420402 RepID=A0ABY5HFQ7_9GAMM|nr:MoaD/ThiS family protein [Marinobacterium rhizophilum]UTW11187.1 MoaD/ThiS family protein [Marinobacterium rhizophilum]